MPTARLVFVCALHDVPPRLLQEAIQHLVRAETRDRDLIYPQTKRRNDILTMFRFAVWVRILCVLSYLALATGK
jgi:hypothetical protein